MNGQMIPLGVIKHKIIVGLTYGNNETLEINLANRFEGKNVNLDKVHLVGLELSNFFMLPKKKEKGTCKSIPNTGVVVSLFSDSTQDYEMIGNGSLIHYEGKSVEVSGLVSSKNNFLIQNRELSSDEFFRKYRAIHDHWLIRGYLGDNQDGTTVKVDLTVNPVKKWIKRLFDQDNKNANKNYPVTYENSDDPKTADVLKTVYYEEYNKEGLGIALLNLNKIKIDFHDFDTELSHSVINFTMEICFQAIPKKIVSHLHQPEIHRNLRLVGDRSRDLGYNNGLPKITVANSNGQISKTKKSNSNNYRSNPSIFTRGFPRDD